MARDTAVTRQKLLGAARQEFAALGVAGARVDRIAERAGVNKERVYGHFGSKEGLFAATVSAAMDELTEAVGKPGDDVAAWVGSVYDFHRERPELLRLLLWEALSHGGSELPGEQRRADGYALKVDALASRLGIGSGPRAAVVLLSLIGLAAWPNAVPQLTRLIVGSRVEEADSPEVVRGAVVDLAAGLVNGIRGADAPE
ncbi:TetR/AcrR family transcriptional regulator [Streptomyces yaizuensis]|uniref:TetR/AcrR family transcriptional regulator n=1 Tax=Streptomyces yaizuensis TaxID=2989713 RepID=A0ABQ5PA21_9ACTN|nr:TetR/AcrR family transcriptional regulator [Streptomyces sp. YSPA8]GLF99335.1 TetR/AcrR family transcriptional regulator [Streptomyces sp. YSPA8]